MTVGEEYLVSSDIDWASTPSTGRISRARLIDKGKWDSRFLGEKGIETRPVSTESGVLDLPQRVYLSKYSNDVLIEVLDAETGEPREPRFFRTCRSHDLKGPWEEMSAIRAENRRRADIRARERREREDLIARRITRIHDALDTTQQHRYGGNPVVILSLDDAERVVTRLNGATA